jgi:hypothetical protein
MLITGFNIDWMTSDHTLISGCQALVYGQILALLGMASMLLFIRGIYVSTVIKGKSSQILYIRERL